MKHVINKYGNLLLPFERSYKIIKSHLIRYPRSEGGYDAIAREKMIAYNKVRYHGAKKLLCYNPFVNIFFNVKGHAIACCRSHDTILGKYPDQSIKEIWFGEQFEKMREHMRHNDLNMGCDYCKMQLKTDRFHAIPSMNPDEFASDKTGIYPRTMELELSNRCNLQCIMCSGRVSSAIRKHREKLPAIESPYDDAFVEQLKEFIPHLKNMYFYGGEPFLIDIYYQIWDEVMKINPKVKLFVVSNGNVYNDRIKKLLKATDFNVIISLDSLKKERYEYIRQGGSFEVIMKNIDRFNSLIKGNLSISHTPMQINWDDTPEIINFCNRIDARINLSYVEGPARFALWAFPPGKLEEVYRYYDNVEWEPTKNRYTAKYNIKVFNEWKEQVKYFRDRNWGILDDYGNIDTMARERIQEIASKIKQVFSELPYEHMSPEKAIEIVREVMLSASLSPAKIEAMDKLLWYLNDDKSMKFDSAKIAMKYPEKFRAHLKELAREDVFWEKYY